MPTYTINISDEVDRAIKDLMNRTRMTREQVLLAAIASYVYLRQHTQEEGKKVSITNKQDRIVQNVDLPDERAFS